MPQIKIHEHLRTGKTCPKCKHSHFPWGVSRDRLGNCFYNGAPTPFVVGFGTPAFVADPKRPPMGEPVIRSFYPTVGYDGTCAYWESAPEGDYSEVERLPMGVMPPPSDPPN
jgi:hypothetical protein